MSRGRRGQRRQLYRIHPAQERANRDKLLPDNLSWSDRLCYRVVDKLAWTQEFILRHLVKEAVWRSGSGEVKRIRDLDDRHLENIVRLIDRGGAELDAHLVGAIYEERLRRWERPEGI